MARHRWIRATTTMTVLGWCWTVIALLIAHKSLDYDTGLSVLWVAVFPVAWVLIHHSQLLAAHRDVIVVGTAHLGSALVILGAWMGWLFTSPFFTGERSFPTGPRADPIVRGFQPFDLPLVTLAVLCALVVHWTESKVHIAMITITTGLAVLLVAAKIATFVGTGIWTYTWGYYVTGGGGIALVYAGLMALSLNRP